MNGLKKSLSVDGFDWDQGNLGKCAKHGVSQVEIEELFRSGPAVAPDVRHSTAEDRFLAIGRTAAGRALFVAFTFRRQAGKWLIRPISARYMHRKEVAAYEKKSSPAEE